MGETLVWTDVMTFAPSSSSLFYFLQLYLPYVRATAAFSLLYPFVTQMINLSKLGASTSATHACLVHSDLSSKVFSQAVSKSLQRHPSSKRTLWPLCISAQLKVRG